MKGKTDATFRIHLGLVLAQIICWSAFIFEIKRAIAGNTLSWAYVFEWPILGLYAIYMWKRLLREERGETSRAPAEPVGPDPQLDAWNEYLASVHEHDHDGVRDKLSD